MTTLDVPTKCSRPESFVSKRALTRIALLILNILFLPIMFVVVWLTLEMIADDQQFTHKPWATLTGVEVRNAKDCEQAVKHHGKEALLRRWDGKAWVFPREQNGKTEWCKAFAFLNNQQRRQ